MEKYHLYLDESSSNNGLAVSHRDYKSSFCVAGIIVKEDLIDTLSVDLNNLKRTLWSDIQQPESIILHEMEVRNANRRNNNKPIDPLYTRFRVRRITRTLYQGLNSVLIQSNCKVIGASINTFEMQRYFGADLETPEYLVTFQIILENFCHFLHSVNGIGEVYYESQDDVVDARLRKHYNQIKSNGSMFIKAEKMQKHLREIEFPKKSENVPGLQIADFVPNGFARKTLGFNSHSFNIDPLLRRISYDGGISNKDRFGVKIMP